MCGPRQLFFFQGGPEMPKGWTHLAEVSRSEMHSNLHVQNPHHPALQLPNPQAWRVSTSSHLAEGEHAAQRQPWPAGVMLPRETRNSSSLPSSFNTFINRHLLLTLFFLNQAVNFYYKLKNEFLKNLNLTRYKRKNL